MELMTFRATEPSRVRWGRRLGCAIAIIAVAIFVSHMIWSFAESSGVRRQVATLKAAGEPILPADFSTAQDGPDNGGDDILAAGKTVHDYSEANSDYAQLEGMLP